jgi:hypothetical protein
VFIVAKVTVTERGNKIPDLMRRLKRLASTEIHIGVLSGEKGADSELVMIASMNEFGVSSLHIPERSFIRNSFELYRSDIEKAFKMGIQQVVKGAEPDQIMGQIGEAIVGKIVDRIDAGIAPANAPSTIEQKGSSKPLIDTGRLKQSITWKVVNK